MPGKSMAWKREMVPASPPRGTKKMLKCRNNPKNQPKGIMNVKPSQDVAEPGGRLQAAVSPQALAGRQLPCRRQAALPGPAVPRSRLKPISVPMSDPALKITPPIPPSDTQLLKHLLLYGRPGQLIASPGPERTTEMAKPETWPRDSPFIWV